MIRMVSPHGERLFDDLPTAIAQARKYARQTGIEVLLTTAPLDRQLPRRRLMHVGAEKVVTLDRRRSVQELRIGGAR